MSGDPHSSVEPPQDAMAGTALDLALQRMARAPDDAAARLRFHAELTQSEIFVLLETEVEGARMTPRVFDLSDGRAVLGFETEWQLAGFAGDAAAYAALPGRVLVSMLAQADQPLSLIVSPDTPHAALVSPEALRWLDQTLAAASPDETEATPESFTAPGLPDGVLSLLVPALSPPPALSLPPPLPSPPVTAPACARVCTRAWRRGPAGQMSSGVRTGWSVSGPGIESGGALHCTALTMPPRI